MNPVMETRTVPLGELRFADGDDPVVEGRAIVFDELSVDFGGWVERFAPGSIELDDDLLILFDHDTSMVLGRTSSGTATAGIDERGVTFRAEPPSTSWWADLQVSMKRGDISQCSFAFMCEDDNLLFDSDLNTVVRTVTKARVSELSIVAMPAYPQTSSVARERVAEVRSAHLNDTTPEGDAPEGDAGAAPACEPEQVFIPGIGIRTFPASRKE